MQFISSFVSLSLAPPAFLEKAQIRDILERSRPITPSPLVSSATPMKVLRAVLSLTRT